MKFIRVKNPLSMRNEISSLFVAAFYEELWLETAFSKVCAQKENAVYYSYDADFYTLPHYSSDLNPIE